MENTNASGPKAAEVLGLLEDNYLRESLRIVHFSKMILVFAEKETMKPLDSTNIIYTSMNVNCAYFKHTVYNDCNLFMELPFKSA